MQNSFVRGIGFICLLAFGVNAAANEEEVSVGGDGVVPLYEGKPFLHVMHQGKSVKVQRIQDREYELRGYFAKTVRDCPPFCLNPISAGIGVATVGEREVFDFMENHDPGLSAGHCSVYYF